MTEKRFKLLYSKLDNGMFIDKEKKFDDIFVDKEFQKIGLIKIVDLLNDLNDENIELHIQNDFLKDENQHMRELVNENEQLKKILGFLKNDNAEDILNVLNSQENEICELKQENEQLKKEKYYYKRELQKELVCQAIIDRREKND